MREYICLCVREGERERERERERDRESEREIERVRERDKQRKSISGKETVSCELFILILYRKMR